MISNKVVLVALMMVASVMCALNQKDFVYNVTEENFEEFVEMARAKNATFYLKFYSRKPFIRPSYSHVSTLPVFQANIR
jgi:hypothetical protein